MVGTSCIPILSYWGGEWINMVPSHINEDTIYPWDNKLLSINPVKIIWWGTSLFGVLCSNWSSHSCLKTWCSYFEAFLGAIGYDSKEFSFFTRCLQWLSLDATRIKPNICGIIFFPLFLWNFYSSLSRRETWSDSEKMLRGKYNAYYSCRFLFHTSINWPSQLFQKIYLPRKSRIWTKIRVQWKQ